MKKIIALLLVLVMIIGLVACGKTPVGIPFTLAAIVPAYIYIWLIYGV